MSVFGLVLTACDITILIPLYVGFGMERKISCCHGHAWYSGTHEYTREYFDDLTKYDVFSLCSGIN